MHLGVVKIFQKLKTFWNTFWNSIKTAYNKAFKAPVESGTQSWRDIRKINLLDIFVSKLNNLTNIEATFEVESDSVQADKLKTLVKDIEGARYDITAGMLADGDYYVFPYTNENGDILHSFLTQAQVRILRADNEEIKEVEAIVDWYTDKDNKTYFLCRHHSLDENSTLTVSYRVVNERNESVYLKEWENYTDSVYKFSNANIGMGRYKSPVSSRGLSDVYGVPLNFGCAEIEAKIFNDMRLIEAEFKNGKSVIFTDPRNFISKDKSEFVRPYGEDVMDNIIPVQSRAGQNSNVDIFNPNLRFSEHYSKLVSDLAMYEKQVGTSKGILTDNETSETATATAVKRANADTIALLSKIRTAIDKGNEMTLKADAMYLNIADELWSYRADWYDPFEDPAEQWKRLLDARNVNAAEPEDLIKWMFPSLSSEEIAEKKARMDAEDTSNTIERLLGGA